MSGQDWAETGEPTRLLTQLEKKLDINVSLLDYWDAYTYGIEIECGQVSKLLERLKVKIEEKPDFFTRINYPFDVPENYLKINFLSDVSFLIRFIQLHIKNGAKKINYQSL